MELKIRGQKHLASTLINVDGMTATEGSIYFWFKGGQKFPDTVETSTVRTPRTTFLSGGHAYAYRCVACSKLPAWQPENTGGMCATCYLDSQEADMQATRHQIIINENGTSKNIERLEKQIAWQQELIDTLIEKLVDPQPTHEIEPGVWAGIERIMEDMERAFATPQGKPHRTRRGQADQSYTPPF